MLGSRIYFDLCWVERAVYVVLWTINEASLPLPTWALWCRCGDCSLLRSTNNAILAIRGLDFLFCVPDVSFEARKSNHCAYLRFSVRTLR